MKRLRYYLFSLAAVIGPSTVQATEVPWPGGAQAAVSLSYDDALASQLDNAVPVLNARDIKASFYPLLSSPVVAGRLNEWRALAEAGHELGNHSLFHPCSASKPHREWVKPIDDIDRYTVEQMERELRTANGFLKAIDGKNQRTFTPPCLDVMAKDGNYIKSVESDFVAIKGNEKNLPSDKVHYLFPEGQSGEELIAFVKTAAQSGGLVNIIFHGIGGDHMSVSAQEHAELVDFLANHRDIYWTDTYLNIMTHVNQAADKAINRK